MDARLQLHWSVQLIAAVGQSFVQERADDSHRGMVYEPASGRFVGEPTDTEPPLRLCVRPSDLAALAVDRNGDTIDEAALQGMTLEHARSWTAGILANALERVPEPLARPEYDMPDHDVGRGAPFVVNEPEALRELARWYFNGHVLLEHIASDTPGASAVRVWPHHFDIGMLITLDPGADAESARAVGVGLSPGDEGIAEPYWYVNAYPRPDVTATDLPDLPAGGRWNLEGWFGAVLTGSAVVGRLSSEEQRAGSLDFLRAAISAARGLLTA